MSVKMYLSWRTKQRKFSPLGAKHHFLLLFCPPVRLHLHKREMGLSEQMCHKDMDGSRTELRLHTFQHVEVVSLHFKSV